MLGCAASTFQTSILPFCALDCAPGHLSGGTGQGIGFQNYSTSHRKLAQRSFLAGERREKHVYWHFNEAMTSPTGVSFAFTCRVWKTWTSSPNICMVAASSGLEVRLMISFEHLIPAIVFITLVFQECLVWCGKSFCSSLVPL